MEMVNGKHMLVHSRQGTYTMYGPSIYHYLVHLMCGEAALAWSS